MSENPCHAAARAYAARGWRVLPLHIPTDEGCSCRKGADCDSPGKHPRVMEWTHKATTDRDQIDDWWRMWPDSNVGVATGGDPFVLDIDAEGWAPLAEMLREHGPLGETVMVNTGSDQAHLYFTAPADAASFTIADGLEVKAAGRQVAAPPSLHASGRRYQWAAGDELLPAPAWLLRKPRSLPVEDGAKIRPGGRHDAQLALAGAMRNVGAGQAEIEAALLAFNRERCDPPKDEAVVRKLAEDVLRYPPNGALTARFAELHAEVEELRARAPAPDSAAMNGAAATEQPEPETTTAAVGKWGLIDGATFVLDAPEGVPAVWGEGQAVAWPRGEPLGIVGPQGVGKTTIFGQLLRGLLGLQDDLLGLPIATIEGSLLLLALDRPAQAVRALRRVLGEQDRDVLRERLLIRRHRLPFDLLREPAGLAQMALDAGRCCSTPPRTPA
jgi:hypothetical protein